MALADTFSGGLPSIAPCGAPAGYRAGVDCGPIDLLGGPWGELVLCLSIGLI